jgi:hypothetical protein
MPIWLRRLTYQQIAENKEKEANPHKKSNSTTQDGKTSIDLANPNVDALPDYAKSSTPLSFNTKAFKK